MDSVRVLRKLKPNWPSSPSPLHSIFSGSDADALFESGDEAARSPSWEEDRFALQSNDSRSSFEGGTNRQQEKRRQKDCHGRGPQQPDKNNDIPFEGGTKAFLPLGSELSPSLSQLNTDSDSTTAAGYETNAIRQLDPAQTRSSLGAPLPRSSRHGVLHWCSVVLVSRKRN